MIYIPHFLINKNTRHLLAVISIFCCTFTTPVSAAVILDIIVDQVDYFVEVTGSTTQVIARYTSSQPVLLNGDWSVPAVPNGAATNFSITMKTAPGTSIFFKQPTGPGYRGSYGSLSLTQTVAPFGGPTTYTQPDAIGFAKLGFENLGGGYLSNAGVTVLPSLSVWTGSVTMSTGWSAGGAFQFDGLTNNYAVGIAGVQAVDLPHDFYFYLGASYWTSQFAGPDTSFSGLTTVPVPAAAWLFVSGILALLGIARRKTSV